MHEKEPQEPPEHTSEHVKSQNFLGARPPSHNPFCGAPLFVFALGPPNPLGGPVHHPPPEYGMVKLKVFFFLPKRTTEPTRETLKFSGSMCPNFPSIYILTLPLPGLMTMQKIVFHFTSLSLFLATHSCGVWWAKCTSKWQCWSHQWHCLWIESDLCLQHWLHSGGEWGTGVPGKRNLVQESANMPTMWQRIYSGWEHVQ